MLLYDLNNKEKSYGELQAMWQRNGVCRSPLPRDLVLCICHSSKVRLKERTIKFKYASVVKQEEARRQEGAEDRAYGTR
jgi:hypothetical protein